ncbi:MAG: hypothetical protein R6U61_04395 [Thermoplasmata archaeon]
MDDEYSRLEGAYQIERVKRLAKLAFIPQSIAIVIIFSLFLYLSGAQFKPFYLPLFFPLVIVFLWLLVLAIESFAFRLLEIRYRKSESAKFIMAQHSMKKAYTIIIISVIILGLTATPFLSQQIEKNTSSSNEVDVFDTEDKTIYFVSRGRFNFIFTDQINVRVLDARNLSHLELAEVTVKILSIEDYEANRTDLYLNRGVNKPKKAEYQNAFEYDMPDPRVKFGEYYVVMNTTHNVTVEYEITTDLPLNRTYPYSLLSLGFIVAYSVWVYIMYPIKKKYSGEGIYE